MLPATMAVLGLTGPRPPDTCDVKSLEPVGDFAPKKLLVIGKTGAGKSTLCNNIIVFPEAANCNQPKMYRKLQNALSLLDFEVELRPELSFDEEVSSFLQEQGDIHPEETPSMQVEVGVALWEDSYIMLKKEMEMRTKLREADFRSEPPDAEECHESSQLFLDPRELTEVGQQMVVKQSDGGNIIFKWKKNKTGNIQKRYKHGGNQSTGKMKQALLHEGLISYLSDGQKMAQVQQWGDKTSFDKMELSTQHNDNITTTTTDTDIHQRKFNLMSEVMESEAGQYLQNSVDTKPMIPPQKMSTQEPASGRPVGWLRAGQTMDVSGLDQYQTRQKQRASDHISQKQRASEDSSGRSKPSEGKFLQRKVGGSILDPIQTGVLLSVQDEASSIKTIWTLVFTNILVILVGICGNLLTLTAWPYSYSWGSHGRRFPSLSFATTALCDFLGIQLYMIITKMVVSSLAKKGKWMKIIQTSIMPVLMITMVAVSSPARTLLPFLMITMMASSCKAAMAMGEEGDMKDCSLGAGQEDMKRAEETQTCKNKENPKEVVA